MRVVSIHVCRVHICFVQVYWLKNLSASANPMSCTCHPMFMLFTCSIRCTLYVCVCMCVFCFANCCCCCCCHLASNIHEKFFFFFFIFCFEFRIYCILYFARHLNLSHCVLTMDLGNVTMTLPPIRIATSKTNWRIIEII